MRTLSPTWFHAGTGRHYCFCRQTQEGAVWSWLTRAEEEEGLNLLYICFIFLPVHWLDKEVTPHASLPLRRVCWVLILLPFTNSQHSHSLTFQTLWGVCLELLFHFIAFKDKRKTPEGGEWTGSSTFWSSHLLLFQRTCSVLSTTSGSSQPLRSPAPGDPDPSSSPCRHWLACVMHT